MNSGNPQIDGAAHQCSSELDAAVLHAPSYASASDTDVDESCASHDVEGHSTALHASPRRSLEGALQNEREVGKDTCTTPIDVTDGDDLPSSSEDVSDTTSPRVGQDTPPHTESKDSPVVKLQGDRCSAAVDTFTWPTCDIAAELPGTQAAAADHCSHAPQAATDTKWWELGSSATPSASDIVARNMGSTDRTTTQTAKKWWERVPVRRDAAATGGVATQVATASPAAHVSSGCSHTAHSATPRPATSGSVDVVRHEEKPPGILSQGNPGVASSDSSCGSDESISSRSPILQPAPSPSTPGRSEVPVVVEGAEPIAGPTAEPLTDRNRSVKSPVAFKGGAVPAVQVSSGSPGRSNTNSTDASAHAPDGCDGAAAAREVIGETGEHGGRITAVATPFVFVNGVGLIPVVERGVHRHRLPEVNTISLRTPERSSTHSPRNRPTPEVREATQARTPPDAILPSSHVRHDSSASRSTADEDVRDSGMHPAKRGRFEARRQGAVALLQAKSEVKRSQEREASARAKLAAMWQQCAAMNRAEHERHAMLTHLEGVVAGVTTRVRQLATDLKSALPVRQQPSTAAAALPQYT